MSQDNMDAFRKLMRQVNMDAFRNQSQVAEEWQRLAMAKAAKLGAVIVHDEVMFSGPGAESRALAFSDFIAKLNKELLCNNSSENGLRSGDASVRSKY